MLLFEESKELTLFIDAFGKADLLYISYLSSCSSVKFETNTLKIDNVLNEKKKKLND